MRSAWIRIALAGGALGLALSAQARLPAHEPAAGAAMVPKPELARIAALGFDSLLADVTWLRAVQLVGGEASNPVHHAAAIGRLTETVAALDPWVDHPYRFAALWMSESAADLDAANRILERGIAYHPTDWRNRFYLAFNHFYFRADSERAVEELLPALALEDAPTYLGRLVARLRSDGGDLEAAAAFVQQMLETSDDDFHRWEYEKALREIETERRARQLDAARETFRQRHGFDVVRVEELAWGPNAVLFTLPAEPNGAEWTIDAETGLIVSSHYGRRYRLNFQDPADAARHEQARAARATTGGEPTR